MSDDIHPGKLLARELEARGWSQMDLTFVLGANHKTVNQIVNGKQGISPVWGIHLTGVEPGCLPPTILWNGCDGLGASSSVLWPSLERPSPSCPGRQIANSGQMDTPEPGNVEGAGACPRIAAGSLREPSTRLRYRQRYRTRPQHHTACQNVGEL